MLSALNFLFTLTRQRIYSWLGTVVLRQSKKTLKRTLPYNCRITANLFRQKIFSMPKTTIQFIMYPTTQETATVVLMTWWITIQEGMLSTIRGMEIRFVLSHLLILQFRKGLIFGGNIIEIFGSWIPAKWNSWKADISLWCFRPLFPSSQTGNGLHSFVTDR